MIKQLCSKYFLTITSGIRLAGSATDDQKRILTPTQAVEQGTDYLVIGRPITKNADPLQQLVAINQELAEII